MLTTKLTTSWCQPGTGSRGMSAAPEQSSINLLPLHHAQGMGCACCTDIRAQTMLYLAHLLFLHSSLSGCLPEEWTEFSIWNEQQLGLVPSSSAAHIRSWGTKWNALSCLRAPLCSQLPEMYLSHRWAALPLARAQLPRAHRV